MSAHGKKPNWAWYVLVPTKAEFTQPQFHFGERVEFCQEYGDVRSWETGRIIGLKFSEQDQWIYSIQLDSNSLLIAAGVQEITAKQSELKLVKDSCSIGEQLQSQQEWFHTTEAASRLGLSPEQLRKLRLNGLFKQRYHYRDTSVPGSARPQWQWQVDRCSKALELPSEKRLRRNAQGNMRGHKL